MKECKKILHANSNQKNVRMIIILKPGKMHIKSRTVSRDKESHYITIKGSVSQEDITIINTYKLKSGTYIPNINISEERK